MLFALSPRAKGRVERMAETFQDRGVTELRLAGTSGIGEANNLLEHFLRRLNRHSGLRTRTGAWALCFKYTRRVAKDNTVRFQLHTLQLLPGPERPSYTPAAVEVLEGLDGCWCVIRDAPSPPGRRPVRYFSKTATAIPMVFRSRPPAPTARENAGQRFSNRWTQGQRMRVIKGTSPKVRLPPRRPQSSLRASRPSFRGRAEGEMEGGSDSPSLRAIERELGIHRAAIRKQMDAEGPPTR